jgi:hypothetical protein
LNCMLDPDPRLDEFTRWIILMMLYACRPGAASERILLRVLQSLHFDCELDDVRQGLKYMTSVGLVQTASDRCSGWRARLTSLGAAVIEYKARPASDIRRRR